MHIPDRFTETAPGVYEQPPEPATSAKLTAHYTDSAETILRNDARHYRKFADTLRDRIDASGIRTEACIAIGGGHPKLEATAGFEIITVVDPLALEYEARHDLFEEHFGPHRVKYMQGSSALLKNIMTALPFTLVHFLEHLSADDGRQLLQLIAPRPVIIYGPNIEAANGPDWFHFRPKDHNTFWTASALAGELERMGYGYVDVTRHCDDYLIIANKDKTCTKLN